MIHISLDNYKYYKNITAFIIFTFIILFYLSHIFILKNEPWGESDDYILPTIALEQHFSDDIRESDIEIAYTQYPEYAHQWDAWKKGGHSYEINGKRYTWYFPTYSIMALPFVYFFRLFGLSQSYGFTVANAIYYILALLLILKLPIAFFLRIAAILILGFGPAIFYINIAHAEVAISALLIYTMVFLFTNSFKSSMLCYSLASTINITLSPFCIFIYFYVFTSKNKGKLHFKSLINAIKVDKRLYLFLILINIVAFFPCFLNLIRMGQLASMQRMGTFDNVTQRIWVFLADLNIGILPYFPIFLIVIFLTLIFSNSRIQYIVFLIVSGITLFGYSLMSHIASGTLGIARYSSWLMSLIIVGTLYFSNCIKNNKIKIIEYFLIVFSFIWTSGIVFNYGHINSQNANMWYKTFQPLARYVLNRWPATYNPFPAIFASKTTHLDGGSFIRYGTNDYTIPIIYKNEKGEPVKILCPPLFANLFQNNINVDAKYKKIFEKEISKIKDSAEIGYLNFPPYAKATLYNYYSFGITGDNNALKQGFAKPELFGAWTDKNESILTLPIEKHDINELTLVVRPFLNDKIPSQRIEIVINGKYSREFILSVPKIQLLNVPIKDVGTAINVTILNKTNLPPDAGPTYKTGDLRMFLYSASIH